MNSTNSQSNRIRDHLEQGKRITQIEALNFFQCFRLASRICDLRRDGLPIQSRTKTLKNGKKVSEYYLLPSTINRINEKNQISCREKNANQSHHQNNRCAISTQ